MSSNSEYKGLTVPELRRLARDRGLSGYSAANKTRLLSMLGQEKAVVAAASAAPASAAPASAASAAPASAAPASANCDDKLYFYSQSRDAVVGRGANEVVSDPSQYRELAITPHWRRILSNFHVCPFLFRGFTYRTIEHVFQAMKIAIASPARADEFTVESGTVLGSGDGLVARKARKLVLLTSEQQRQWAREQYAVLSEAAEAKYSTCPEAKEVLLATGCAQLWHIVSRSQPIRFTHLEELRRRLRVE